MQFEVELPKEKATVWDDHVPIIQSQDKRHTDVYITDAFIQPAEYNKLCRTLLNANRGDKFTFYINSPGGLAQTAFMVIDAMKKTKAKIHGYISGEVASAGTLVTMFCDTLEVADHTSFMCHNYSHGASGGGAQVKEYVNFTDRESSKALAAIYENFLSPQELEDISTRDKEIWLNAGEVVERWANKMNPPKKSIVVVTPDEEV